MTETRPYRMRKRAESQQDTRRRIVEATMRLHEEVGPRATTISAIAERAGVQRLTVYRHFPDETAVFQACTSEWLRRNPPPDAGRWRGLDDAGQRLRSALAAFYGYYARTRRMWSAAHRDMAGVPALQAPMAEFGGYVAAVAQELAAGYGTRGRAKAQAGATIRHALAFPTWEDFEALGLADAAKVALVQRWLAGVAARQP